MLATMVDDLLPRIWPALLVALASVIAGGLLSAVTAHAANRPAAWASAYLVLVCGVGTGGLAVGRGLFSTAPLPTGRAVFELTAWLLGNALVLIGTLLRPPWLVEIGSALLVLALGSLVAGVRRGTGSRLLRGLFMALVIVLLVSIPVGVFLSHLGR